MNTTAADLHILTFPTPTPMSSYRTACWLKANTDHNGLTHAIADIAGIALTRTLPAQYLVEQLFNGPDAALDADIVSDLDTDCQSITGLANGLIRIHVTFHADEFINEYLCRATGCDADASTNGGFAGYCADCADTGFQAVA